MSVAATLASVLSFVAARPASIGLSSMEGFLAINPVVAAGCMLDFSGSGPGGGMSPDAGNDNYDRFDPYAGSSLPVQPAAGAKRADTGYLPILPVSLYGFLLAALFAILAAGITCKTFRLYAWLRESPEMAGKSHVTPLTVTDIGQDTWSGFGNPILTRELRTRLRSGDARSFVAIAALLSCAAFLIPLLGSIGSQIEAPQLAEIARSSFIAVCVMQLAIIAMIGPGLGAEVIAMEKEKKTWDMLVASCLSAKDILKGKISGSLCMLALLLSPSLPLLALAAFLHGVEVWMVLSAVLVCAYFVLLVAVTSVSISALARTSISGKWTAYLLSGALLAGLCALIWSLMGPKYDCGIDALVWIPAVSPLALLLYFPAVARIKRPAATGDGR
jgi:hypothetical protein